MEDKSKDSRTLFSILTGRNQHILTIVIIGHLLVEHLIDKIIIAKFEKTNQILKKRFSEKIDLLYPNWLPQSLYKNIKLLNKARNELAHSLGVDHHEFIIYMHHCDVKTLKIPSKKNKEKFYFRELINTILFDLVNDSFYSLNIPNELDLNTLFHSKK